MPLSGEVGRETLLQVRGRRDGTSKKLLRRARATLYSRNKNTHRPILRGIDRQQCLS